VPITGHSIRNLMVALCALGTEVASAGQTDTPEAESIASALPFADWRAPLKASGIDIGYYYIGEYFNVVDGGVSHGGSFNGRLEQTLYLDLAKIVGWTGATLHTHVYGIHGKGPGSSHLGNVMSVSNIEALETVRLFEMWVEQSLLDGRVNVRFGQLAADSEFFISDTAAHFFNGTFGWPGSTAANMLQGGPAYPLATPGVRVALTPSDDVKLQAAIYNGSPANPAAADPQKDNRHGLNFRVDDPPLVMAEGQFGYTFGLPGKFKIGGWHEFSTFSDKLTGAPIDGNSGVYAVLDQTLYRDAATARSIDFLARVSGTPEKQNEVSFYADAGFVLAGFVPGRPKDTIGVAAGYGRVSPRVSARQIADGDPVISDYEAVVELNYNAEIAPGWTIAPDVHYIWHPGGHSENPSRPGTAIDNTIVVGLRTNINY
jgi:porin